MISETDTHESLFVVFKGKGYTPVIMTWSTTSYPRIDRGFLGLKFFMFIALTSAVELNLRPEGCCLHQQTDKECERAAFAPGSAGHWSLKYQKVIIIIILY